jgi:molybdenum cofactor cytidylyltransferase
VKREAITGIVLAAGMSTRMGRPKPLLRTGHETYVERAIRVLGAGGCEPVIAVVNVSWAMVGSLAAGAGARVVRNAEPSAEQIESLRLALVARPPHTVAVVVLPVDVPLVRASTVEAVVTAFRARRPPIVLPSYRGVAGHPVLLASDLFTDLETGPWPEGVRSLLQQHSSETVEIEVDDPGILVDVDTPEQYRLVREGERGHEGDN